MTCFQTQLKFFIKSSTTTYCFSWVSSYCYWYYNSFVIKNSWKCQLFSPKRLIWMKWNITGSKNYNSKDTNLTNLFFQLPPFFSKRSPNEKDHIFDTGNFELKKCWPEFNRTRYKYEAYEKKSGKTFRSKSLKTRSIIRNNQIFITIDI